jgi:hypothetical protein
MTRLFPATLLLSLAAVSLAAHHSYAAYDRTRTVDVEGRLEAFEFVAPHALLRVRKDDRLYVGEWLAAQALTRRHGVHAQSLSTGDRVVITGNPRRDFDESGILNITVVQRPADGAIWPARQPSPAPAPEGSNR